MACLRIQQIQQKEHVCACCHKDLKCPSFEKDEKGQPQECTCTTELLYCMCPVCSHPDSKVKGIVAFVCPYGCDDDLDYSDPDDESDIFILL